MLKFWAQCSTLNRMLVLVLTTLLCLLAAGRPPAGPAPPDPAAPAPELARRQLVSALTEIPGVYGAQALLLEAQESPPVPSRMAIVLDADARDRETRAQLHASALRLTQQHFVDLQTEEIKIVDGSGAAFVETPRLPTPVPSRSATLEHWRNLWDSRCRKILNERVGEKNYEFTLAVSKAPRGQRRPLRQARLRVVSRETEGAQQLLIWSLRQALELPDEDQQSLLVERMSYSQEPLDGKLLAQLTGTFQPKARPYPFLELAVLFPGLFLLFGIGGELWRRHQLTSRASSD